MAGLSDLKQIDCSQAHNQDAQKGGEAQQAIGLSWMTQMQTGAKRPQSAVLQYLFSTGVIQVHMPVAFLQVYSPERYLKFNTCHCMPLVGPNSTCV